MKASLCEVCGNEMSVGVFSVPGVPISMAYGKECRAAKAHPYGILVGNTAVAGDENEGMAGWWMEMVHATLRHLGKTEDEFWDDVAQARRDMTLAESQTE